jgi:hypothetical protein
MTPSEVGEVGVMVEEEEEVGLAPAGRKKDCERCRGGMSDSTELEVSPLVLLVCVSVCVSECACVSVSVSVMWKGCTSVAVAVAVVDVL